MRSWTVDPFSTRMNTFRLTFLHTEEGHKTGLALASVFKDSEDIMLYQILLTYCQTCGLLLKPYAHFNSYIMAL
jgi:hypothetical protein